MRVSLFVLLFATACFSPPAPSGVSAGPAPDARVAPAAPPDAAPPDAAPPPADAAPPDLKAERTVRARFVSGDRRIIACGVIAFIGVYVYEVVEVEDGPALSGKFVADVLCPDMALGKGVKLAPGEVHRMKLGPAKRAYAGARPPAAPEEGLPRFEATKIELAK